MLTRGMQPGKHWLRIQRQVGWGACKATAFWGTVLSSPILIWRLKYLSVSIIYSSVQHEKGKSRDTSSASFTHIHSSAAHTANTTHQSKCQGVLGTEYKQHIKSFQKKGVIPGHRDDIHQRIPPAPIGKCAINMTYSHWSNYQLSLERQ